MSEQDALVKERYGHVPKKPNLAQKKLAVSFKLMLLSCTLCLFRTHSLRFS